jgi:hypothetical protein
MDNSFRQQESDSRQPGGFLVICLQIFNEILRWLVGLVQLKEEEKRGCWYLP